ncbi:hypothetical protein F0L17_25075 [Streptomyces sp. TRM43335]|uniref:Uncharacterized protein n=1 Tax=Streptomyces taklimakanensis TaxID=2569853 RepID=A0A6G2BJC3_9ACTN|nr:hypothetical protein [Streptomyces taklimakanensis]MTE22314.1 hypothetical protein [Streptomyces taklimakanensis]
MGSIPESGPGGKGGGTAGRGGGLVQHGDDPRREFLPRLAAAFSHRVRRSAETLTRTLVDGLRSGEGFSPALMRRRNSFLDQPYRSA